MTPATAATAAWPVTRPPAALDQGWRRQHRAALPVAGVLAAIPLAYLLLGMSSLDVRGEICPYPMLKTEQTLKTLPPGEALEVLTDHPPALHTVPRAAERLGFRTHVEEIGPSEWLLTFWK